MAVGACYGLTLGGCAVAATVNTIGVGGCVAVGGLCYAARKAYQYHDVPPIIAAMRSRDLDTITRLVAEGTDINQLYEGVPLVSLAFKEFGFTSVLQHLLALGASPNTYSAERMTPLGYAVVYGATGTVDCFANHKKIKLTAPMKLPGQLTALHLAIPGKYEIAKLLLGKDPWQAENVDAQGNTPLHRAVYLGDVEMVKILMATPAGVDLTKKMMLV